MLVKFSVFFVVCSVTLVQASLYLEGITSLLPEITDLAPDLKLAVGHAASGHRVKRKAIIVPLVDPNECVGKCAQSMHERVNKLYFNDNDTDADKLHKFCQTYAPFGTCFPTCPPSKLKSLVSEFFPVMNLLCELGAGNFTDLLVNFDCLDKIKETAEQKCELQCGNGNNEEDEEQEAKVHLNILPNFVIYDNNQTRNTGIIKETCKYLSCMDKCSEPIILQACGVRAVKLEDKFVSTMLTSLLNTFKEMNAILAVPTECKPLVKSPRT